MYGNLHTSLLKLKDESSLSLVEFEEERIESLLKPMQPIITNDNFSTMPNSTEAESPESNNHGGSDVNLDFMTHTSSKLYRMKYVYHLEIREMLVEFNAALSEAYLILYMHKRHPPLQTAVQICERIAICGRIIWRRILALSTALTDSVESKLSESFITRLDQELSKLIDLENDMQQRYRPAVLWLTKSEGCKVVSDLELAAEEEFEEFDEKSMEIEEREEFSTPLSSISSGDEYFDFSDDDVF